MSFFYIRYGLGGDASHGSYFFPTMCNGRSGFAHDSNGEISCKIHFSVLDSSLSQLTDLVGVPLLSRGGSTKQSSLETVADGVLHVWVTGFLFLRLRLWLVFLGMCSCRI